MNKEIVQVRDLTSGYQETAVLDNVSMTAREGEITVILGSSGCGKTTLLKHLIRLYLPWSGTIRLFDQDITRMDETAFNHLLRKVGVLFQNGALLNSLTVSENVAIPLEQHTDLSADLVDRLIKVKLQLVELGYAADRLPAELSGGMRKRAALARALALDPPLLFCDEPSAGLDPITTASLDSLILKLRDWLGVSVVMVSHDIASIMRVADHVVFLDQGRLLFEGPLSEVRHVGVEKIDEFFSKR